jgi:type I restriction enzyme S subunit
MNSDKRLGDHIRLVDIRNGDLAMTDIKGINIEKQFIPTVANTSTVDTSKYKIVASNQFACNLMHVGRDVRVPISINLQQAPLLVSPAYHIFEVVDSGQLDPMYLMSIFRKREFDRKAWFHTDNDVRGGLQWATFCDLCIPIPSIERQRELAAIYRSLLSQIGAYERSIPRLQKICEDYLSEAKKDEKSVRLGNYLGVVDIRNSDKSISRLKGLNINKAFIPSAANVSQTDLGKYKIVRKGQFAYSAMQVGRDECIRVSLYSEDDPIIVSPAYTVFEVLNPDTLNPNFLMLWLKAPETDRAGWFKSDGWSS